jgi:hypothetical protein
MPSLDSRFSLSDYAERPFGFKRISSGGLGALRSINALLRHHQSCSNASSSDGSAQLSPSSPLRASQTVHATHRNQQPDGYYSGRALAGAIAQFVAVPAERALVRPSRWDIFFWVSESKVSFLRHEEAEGYEQAEENAACGRAYLLLETAMHQNAAEAWDC